MRLRWALYLAMVTVSLVGATTIDVSTQTSTVVNTGDTLVFQLLSWSFAVDAAVFGKPSSPTEVSFALGSAPLGGAGEFAATLESADRSVSVAFGDLALGPGYFQGSGYAGEVSTIQGYLSLSPVLSGEIFNGSLALIVLRNEGPDVRLRSSSLRFTAGFILQPVGWTTVRGGDTWFGGPGKQGKSGAFGEFGGSGGAGNPVPRGGNTRRGGAFWGGGPTVRAPRGGWSAFPRPAGA